MIEDHQREQVRALDWLLATAVSCAIAATVWWGLLNGGGLIGGDTHTYFLPQKMVMAEAFASGETPLWHPKTGLGYPLLAESQAGVFYPANQVLYRFLAVDTAYHFNIVAHYCLAFVFAWRFGRCQRLSNPSSLLVALIFVYGWFPARISHEWSIIGGMWFPLTLWLTDQLLQTRSKRLLIALALCLAAHLLSGHFTLAFVNQLTLLGYATIRIVQAKSGWRRISLPICAIGLSTAFAAIQLLPTYELKLNSQRHGEAKKFDPAFGHMPPVYASQLFASWWYWHTPEILQNKQMARTPGAMAADTNHVEAHLYWGLIPFGLVLLSFTRTIRSKLEPSIYWTWLALVAFAMVYASGWLVPVTRLLPGFGFFNGPGRYTIICALGGAIIAASVFEALTRRSSRPTKWLLAVIVGGLTLPDMLLSSRHVADAVVIPTSPLQKLETSWIRKAMSSEGASTKRLLAPGPNVGNFFGTSCVPQYLGLGPAIYYDDLLMPATAPTNELTEFPDAAELSDLNLLGITHVLTTSPIGKPSENIRLLQQYPDSFLNTIWGRGTANCYLYEFATDSKRIFSANEDVTIDFEVTTVTGNSFEFMVDLDRESNVVLKELNYSGWKVWVDNVATEPSQYEPAPFLRSVPVPAGRHTVRWEFQPVSFTVGAWISFAALLAAMCFAFWSPKPNVSHATKVAE